MVAWRDEFAARQQPPTPPPVLPVQPVGGTLQQPISGLQAIPVSQLGGGGGAFSSSRAKTITTRVPKSAAAPPAPPRAGPPQVITGSLPFSTQAPGQESFGPLQPASAEGGPFGVLQQVGADLFRGSTGGASVGNAFVLPLQAPAQLAHALHDALPGDNRVAAFSTALDAGMTGIAMVSAPIATVMNAPVNFIRDEGLKKRTGLYAALISAPPGTLVDPAASRVAGESPIIGVGSIIDLATLAFGTLFQTDKRIPAQVAAESIDLPPELKTAIEANPQLAMDPTKVDKLISDVVDAKGGPGRLLTYTPGPLGEIANSAPYLALFVGEAVLTGGISSAATGLAEGTAAAPLVAGFAKGISLGQQITKYYAAAGIGYYGATAMLDAGARITGNQAALDFALDAWSYHPIQDNPDVQLVASLAYNPLGAFKSLLGGTMKMGHGVDVAIGAVTGRRIARLITDDDYFANRFSTIYGIDPASVPDAVNTYFGGSQGRAINHIVKLAAQVVVDGLPTPVRNALQATYTDAAERATAVMRVYHDDIGDVIANHVDDLARHVQVDYKIYRGFRAPYNPDEAMGLASRYHDFSLRTYDIRAEHGWVVDYPQILFPEATTAIREAIAPYGAQIPIEAMDHQIGMYGALGKYLRPVEVGTAERLGYYSGDAINQMLDKADQEFAEAAGRNPILTRSGIDPILRPGHTVRDVADVMGTNEETVNALQRATPEADQDAVRAFLLAKKHMANLTPEEIAALAPEDAWSRANDIMDTMTKPAIQHGEVVSAAEDMVKQIRKTLIEGALTMPENERKKALDLIWAQEQILMRANGPLVPFVTQLRRAALDSPIPDATMRQLARERVQAEMILEQARGFQDQAESILKPNSGMSGAEALAMMKRKADGWVADKARTMPANMRRRLKNYQPYSPHQAVNIDAAPDYQLWQMARDMAGTEKPKLGRKGYDKLLWSADDSKRISEEFASGRVGNPLEDHLPEYDQQGNRMLVETAEAELGRLRGRHDELYYGTSPKIVEKTLKRTQNVPSAYLENAESALYGEARTLYHDYEAETSGVKNLYAELRATLDNPADFTTYAGVGDLVRSYDPLYHAAEDAANSLGVPIDEFLSKTEYANHLKALVTDAAPKVGSIDAALTDAMATGDFTAVNAELKKVGPVVKPPIRGVGLDAAEAFAHGRVAEPPVPETPALIQARADLVEAETKYKAANEAVSLPGNPAITTRAELEQAWGKAADDFAHGRQVFNPETGVEMTGRKVKGDLARGLRKARSAGEMTPEVKAARDEWRAAMKKVKELTPKEAKPKLAAQPIAEMWDRRLRQAQADLQQIPSDTVLAKPENALGRTVLSLVGYGVPNRTSSSLDHILTILRTIQSGEAEAVGFGAEPLAAAQRVAEEILGSAEARAKQGMIRLGVLNKGAHAGQWSPGSYESARELLDKGHVAYADNEAGLTYAIGKPPKGAVVIDLDRIAQVAEETGVAGMAEELFFNSFQKYADRAATAQIRRAFNHIFGPLTNSSILQRTQSEFSVRVARAGIDPKIATKVWEAWGDYARDSAIPNLLAEKMGWGKKKGLGPGDFAIFGGRTNIPNGKLEEEAIKAAMAMGMSRDAAESFEWAYMFREASSPVMRALSESKIPLSDALERVYGKVTNNSIVRFRYYQFRFGLDVRFHAQNYFEPNIMYAGRSALIPGEGNRGMLGATADYLYHMSENHIGNVGSMFTHNRFEVAMKAFWKEQPRALRGALNNMMKLDEDLVHAAFVDEARLDPDLSQVIASMGDTPEGYLAGMQTFYDRILSHVDGSVPFTQDIQELMAQEPAMAEIYGRLDKINRELWEDVKDSLLGNSSRSRAERFMNHYLLFWPFSYTVRTAKWMTKILYDSVGGLPTNSAGAYQLDKMVALHNQQLRNDPGYAKWFEDNKSLVFMAQSLLPISPNNFGFSLNPILRAALFGRVANVFAVGPVYTIDSYIPNIVGDLYGALHDVPVINEALKLAVRMTGRNPPKKYDVAPAPNIEDAITAPH